MDVTHERPEQRGNRRILIAARDEVQRAVLIEEPADVETAALLPGVTASASCGMTVHARDSSIVSRTDPAVRFSASIRLTTASICGVLSG